MVDAVVIGAGPNGLVAANVLADEGWDVLVLEAQSSPGGGVRSAELTLPGHVHDVFSSFYPFAAASPVMQSLGLDAFGLEFARAPHVLANPTPDGRCVVLSTDTSVTAASLESYAAGDGAAWRQLLTEWAKVGRHLLELMLTPPPPIAPALRLVAAVGPSDLARFARFSLLPVRRMAAERFAGQGGALLLAGNAMHSDLAPETALSGMFGWLLASLGAEHGFPVVVGGASRLTDALVARLEARGGRVVCGAEVTEIAVRRGRAEGVVIADGRSVAARRAVIADLAAPTLLLDLLRNADLPLAVVEDARRFEWDAATVKVDWALDGPVPWAAEDARRAGTVHLCDGIDELSEASAALARGAVPARLPLVVGQYSMTDPTRSPPGTETAWAYAHVPHRGRAGQGRPSLDVAEVVAAIEARMEERAPGFGRRVAARHVMGPGDLEARNANLVGGSVNAGTGQLHQQLVFRPIPGSLGASTPIDRLFLASASAHPGGGVHGACGNNAAVAAIRRERRSRRLFVAGAAALVSGGVGSGALSARRRRPRSGP
ncbi:MAG TPA: NAD(P)/FAD-dependent oxidoreductase [Acidimicrobiales bacterium]|nr:NAD(P)/FAD-dependent oxidoreductase [Acidimicrobiales bacterium]